METPLKSVRRYCVKECCLNQPNEVLKCPAKDCVLWKFRLGKGRIKVKDIRSRCKDCNEGTAFAIKNCEFPDCPLFRYRLGTNPARAGQGNHNAHFGKKTSTHEPK